MTALLVMHITISDPERWTKYREAVLPLIARFGGVHLTGAGRAKLLEYSGAAPRLAMFRFPSIEQARAFWTSPEYQPIKAIREAAATLNVWIVAEPDR